MTDLEKRADEYANKEVYYGAYVDEEAGREIVKNTYLDATKAETALLSQHIIDLQKDKGNLTDRVRELEQQIEKMKCCGNCIHCKYDENEESYEFCEKHQQVVNIAIVPCSEYERR